MKTFFSSNNTFVIQAHDNGEAWLARKGTSAPGLLVRSDSEEIELFALLCQHITEHVLAGWDWLVSDYRETDKSDQPDDNATDWSEDDVPY
jgi:hypothetical protein